MEKRSPEETVKWVAIGVAGIAALYLVYKLFKPLDTLLSIPGAIADSASDTARAIRKAVSDPTPSSVKLDEPTTTPGLSTADLLKIADRKVYAAVDGADLRKSANSSAPILKNYSRGNLIGYAWSVANEKLSTGNKTWIVISSAPTTNSPIIGYIPLRVVVFDGVTVTRLLKNDQLNTGVAGIAPKLFTNQSYVN